MKIFEVEIERTYTAFVAAEDQKSAERLASKISDRIVSESMEPTTESVNSFELVRTEPFLREPVYAEDPDINYVYQALQEGDDGDA